MSQTHDIDNGDLLLLLDTYEPSHRPDRLEVSARAAPAEDLTSPPFSSTHRNVPGPSTPPTMSSTSPAAGSDGRRPDEDEQQTVVPFAPLSSGERAQTWSPFSPSWIASGSRSLSSEHLRLAGHLTPPTASDPTAYGAKGKSVSIPIPIYGGRSDRDETIPSPGSSPDSMASPPFPPTHENSLYFSDIRPIMRGVDDHLSGTSAGKGKAREQPPVLPPLDFFPGSIDWSSTDIPSSVAGPSSYGSGITSASDSDRSLDADSSLPVTPITPNSPTYPAIEHVLVPARRRTLSSPSIRSARSVSALSFTKMKGKFSGPKSPTTIARKLLFSSHKKRDGNSSSDEASPSRGAEPAAVVDVELPGAAELGQGSCFLPWARDFKPRSSPTQGPILHVDLGSPHISFEPSPIYRPTGATLRTKGRSYSSPLPFPSVLDIVPTEPYDLFKPPPIPSNPTRYFDEWLPRELKLHILSVLVTLHEDDHARLTDTKDWTALKAAKRRWVGREKGMRELVKFSAVSKVWHGLVFDGQLWAKFSKVPPRILAHLCQTAGGFIKHLECAGYTELTESMLLDATRALSVSTSPYSQDAHTRITTVNLQGCTAVTTRSLHRLLMCSPLLEKLCLKGLSAVTNTTCSEIIAEHCPRLVSLDLSRCRHLDGEGIRALAAGAMTRNEPLRLKVLRLDGLRGVSSFMMRSLGKVTPDLEVLDLCWTALHNSHLEAFVSCTEDEAKNIESVQLTARQLGLIDGPATYWRRLTRLRHLNISYNILTDHACTHLAHTVPKLEFLEIAGHVELRDEGVVRLLGTTPFIRRVDLEGSLEITDTVLAALTPAPEPSPPPRYRGPPPPPQPGHALEHLVIGSAGQLTNDAMTALIRACPRLRVLDADGTRLSGHGLREFVSLARSRGIDDAVVVAIDCRGVGDHTVRELAEQTRPRLGWRHWDARRLAFFDARDEDAGAVEGQDECDARRVVVKTFCSWQTVDAVRAAREKQRKKRRAANGSGSSAEGYGAARTHWWSPSGRARSTPVSPLALDGMQERDGCTIM